MTPPAAPGSSATAVQATPPLIPNGAPVIDVEGVVTRFGTQTIHDGVSFQVQRGTLVALIGGSGTGKSVLLREMIGLHPPTAGRVRLLGTDMWAASPQAIDAVRRRFGMTFQDGALFSSLTVAQNVAVPLREHTRLAAQTIDELVALRLVQAGLSAEAGAKMPSELSGGMRKRAGGAGADHRACVRSTRSLARRRSGHHGVPRHARPGHAACGGRPGDRAGARPRARRWSDRRSDECRRPVDSRVLLGP
jgi:ABC-type ATPase involved in cell division